MSWLSTLFDAATLQGHSHDARDAIKNAASAQTSADQSGINAITQANTTGQAQLAPWITAGTGAVGAQSDLLGLNGNDPQQAAITQLQNSPYYQSLFRNGQNAVLANAAATGGLRGGNVENSLAHFGSDTLAQTIQQQLQNLSGISGPGLSAAGTGAGLGAQSSGNIASLLEQQGAHQAGGILGAQSARTASQNNLTSTISTLLGFNGGQPPAWLSQIFNSGGGGIKTGDFTTGSPFGGSSVPFGDTYAAPNFGNA